MSAGTEPIGWPQPRTSSEDVTHAWLDALAGGICTPETFLGAMREQFQGDRDEGWEVLSLLDQYYRRGKIKAELFHTLKSRLEGSALIAAEDAAASVRARASTTVTAPAATSGNTPSVSAPSGNAPTGNPPSGNAPSVGRPSIIAASVNAASAKRAPPDSRPARPVAREVREVAIGDVLRGRYRVRGVLGQGGMGTVFEAIDEYRLDLPSTGQRIAVKVLHTGVTRREDLLAELQREFQHLQSLSHPNIVRVHEFDRDDDIAFFTMELLNGALLSRVLAARNAIALPRPHALALMRDVGAALAHAHSHGVVHGDINPQNIFVTNAGDVRVLDFGASHRLLRDRWSSDMSQRAAFATPGYASCQLLEGQQPDARDDLFAFACVAYVLLSGLHPFANRTAVEARAQRVRPRRPPGLTGQQWRVLREGLRWDRDRRPADVAKWLDRFELAAAAPHLPPLPELLNAPPPRKPRAILAGASIAMLALLAAGGYWAVTHDDSLANLIMGWSGRARPALDGAGVSPPAPVLAPEDTHQTPPPPATRAAPSTPPPTASRPVPPLRANPSPSPTSIAPIPAEPPAPTAGPRAAAATRPSAGEATAGAVNAGPIRIEMAADTVDVQADERAAHVTVRRRGNLHGDASFRWWTESGTAKPGRDFAPVIPRVEQIANGSGSVSLTIPVLSTPHGKPASFYVVIDRADSGGAALGARTLTMVTIQPPD